MQGPHGYISPGWYDAKPAVPTWNFVTAHLYGTPELLSDDENLRVLDASSTTSRTPMPEPRRMSGTAETPPTPTASPRGTVGFRIRVTGSSPRTR